MTEELDQRIRDTALQMLEEKVNENLEVILIPAPEQMFMGHCIRVAAARNPEWYRELFASYLPKLLDCRLVVKSLYNIAKGTYNLDRQYDGLVYEVVLARIKQIDEENKDVPF